MIEERNSYFEKYINDSESNIWKEFIGNFFTHMQIELKVKKY